jgi:hypothetical protein
MQPSHYGDQYAAIAEVLHRYYEGLYHSDTTLLRLDFHPQAHYVTTSGGELLHLGLGDYLPIVAAHTPPARTGDTYDYVVDTIDLAGPDTASLRIRSTMLGKQFTDLLSLVRVDGKWRIIAKVFHHEPALAAGSAPGDN